MSLRPLSRITPEYRITSLSADSLRCRSTPFTISSAPSPLPILSFEPVVRPVSTSPAKLILGEERNLTALHAAHIRDDPIEVSSRQLVAIRRNQY